MNFCFVEIVMNDYYPTQILRQMVHLRPGQYGHHFPYGSFKCIFLNAIFKILFKILLKIVHVGWRTGEE